MRADRLVSLVLLLRQRGRMSAEVLAQELEVSTRTVLRDIEALGSAGVPVYAERGRRGGFELLPGFRTELMGLNPDEALALLTAGAGRDGQVFGLSAALASAMRKVVDALPNTHQASASDAAQRLLIEPERDLLSRRQASEELDAQMLSAVRRAVLSGRKLRIHYAALAREATWRTIDPIGLVTVRDTGYLLATLDGSDRTYRLSRILAAEVLPDAADRPASVDLERLWEQRSTRFRAGGQQVAVRLRMSPSRREELAGTALAIGTESTDDDGWLRLEATFQDLRHAIWALWQLESEAEALAPEELRSALRGRAVAILERYGDRASTPEMVPIRAESARAIAMPSTIHPGPSKE